MAQTVIEKIVQSHAVGLAPDHEIRAGDFVTVSPDHVMTHDNTSAVMLKFQDLGMPGIRNPRQPVFTLDHDIQDPTPETLARMARIADFAREQGVDFYTAGRGIGHQIMIEEGYVRPGGFCVASDSHSNTYGAVGALGTPVVRTDAAVLWAVGTFWWQVPPTIKVSLNGRLRPGVTAKDVILTLCGMHNQGEVLNAALEFGGNGIGNLSMEERLTIANMTTEWGALVGWFPVDGITLDHMRGRREWQKNRGLTGGITEAMIANWRDNPPMSDPDAEHAAEINLELARVRPHVSGPHSLQVSTSLADLAPRKIRIHKAYLLSCTNARREDLRQAADVMRGHKVARGVEMYLAAASQPVQEQAEADGSWAALLDAGCIPLPPGCGPCIGLGKGLLEAGEVGISATNRNFRGRMGSREAKAYLASPAVVAASALKGYITGPEDLDLGSGGPARDLREIPTTAAPAKAVEILTGFPAAHTGRALVLPAHNLNTDGIFAKDHTYRDDITPQRMAQVVMENHDPDFAGLVRSGDVIVSGRNFGTGSSREQAVTALQAAGIGLVIAASFSQTYLRNAINNGFICLACPALSEAVLGALAPEEGPTIVDDGGVAIDFETSTATWRGGSFPFSPLGEPVQTLVIAGGVENHIRKKNHE